MSSGFQRKSSGRLVFRVGPKPSFDSSPIKAKWVATDKGLRLVSLISSFKEIVSVMAWVKTDVARSEEIRSFRENFDAFKGIDTGFIVFPVP